MTQDLEVSCLFALRRNPAIVVSIKDNTIKFSRAGGLIILDNYHSKNAHILRGCSIIVSGSGVSITGILYCRFCKQVVLTNHNEEVIKILENNIDLHQDSESNGKLKVAKLDWGDFEQMDRILQKNYNGFDLIHGDDICFQHKSVLLVFDNVKHIFGLNSCKFLLGYVSRSKMMDTMVVNEVFRHGLQILEVPGTWATVQNLEGVIYDITPSSKS